MLCSMSEEDGKLIDAIANCNELTIFNTDLIIDFIEWRWTKFAKKTHVRGMYFHLAYIIGLFLYIKDSYGNVG
jgi:hypothetical protein